MRINVFASLSLADSTTKGAKKSSGYCVPECLADPRAFLEKYATPLLGEDEDRTIMLSAPFGRASGDRTLSKKLVGGDASPTALSWMDRAPNAEIQWAIKSWELDQLATMFLYVGAPRGMHGSSPGTMFQRAAEELDRFRYLFGGDATPIFDNDGRSAIEEGLTAAFYATLRSYSRWPFVAGFSFGVEPNPTLDPAPASQRPVNVFEYAKPQYCCASVRCWEAGDANPAKFLSVEACVERGMIPLVTVLGGEFREKSDRIEQGKMWGDRLAAIIPGGKVFVGGINRADLMEMRA